MSYDTYCRPSEGLRVECQDLTPGLPGSLFPTMSVLFNPLLRGTPSKTGIYDDVVPLTSGVRFAFPVFFGTTPEARGVETARTTQGVEERHAQDLASELCAVWSA